MKLYALSIKQPWAALLVHGRKTIEIRRWSTLRRGLVLIHAARVPDDRAEGWQHIGPELQRVAQIQGGILGAALLAECRVYRTQKVFLTDQAKHLNAPEWFEEPGLFGLVFEKATPLPFFPVSGNVRFFSVADYDLERLPEELRPPGVAEGTP